MCRNIETGIHTFSLYHKLSYTEAQNLIELLKKRGYYYPLKENNWNYKGTYKSNLYADLGVQIYIYHYYFYSGFTLRITPCSLLKESYAAENLYHPSSTDNHETEERLNYILNDLEIKSDLGEIITANEMSVCRVDPCINVYLDSDDEILEYLRILKKSTFIPHYHVAKFEETSSHVKNVEGANKHSYHIKSRRAEFTAYDKIYEMQQGNRCPDELGDTHILRIEAELKRDALIKRLDRDEMCSNGKLLKSTAKNANGILVSFLERMQIGTGNHVRYCDAEARIEKAKFENKLKDRMLYLIRKVSDSNLSSALDSMCKEYNLNSNQCDRILNRFDELGISPITLRNNSQFESLPSLISILQENQHSIPKRDEDGFIILEWKNDVHKNRFYKSAV